MQAFRGTKFILNWIFICGLILMALNDHFLKWQFSNWLTGKLSDFAGLLILPMFLLFIFPTYKKAAVLLSGVFFILWKLPMSESFINLYNRVTLIPIVRTLDYTDLIALTILPFSYLLISKVEAFAIRPFLRRSLNPLFIMVPASFIFMSTSPPISYYMKPGGDIHIGKSYKMKISKDAILQKLAADGFSVRLDTSQKSLGIPEYYLVENVVLSGGKDTIKSVQFGFWGNDELPILLLNNVSLSGEWKVSDWKALKRYSRYYRELISSEIIDNLK